TLTNAGTLTIDGNGTRLSGNGTLSNTGTILETAGGALSIDSNTPNATTLANQAGAVFDLQADAIVFTNFGGGTFSNPGTLRRSAGGSLVSNIRPGIVITNNNL